MDKQRENLERLTKDELIQLYQSCDEHARRQFLAFRKMVCWIPLWEKIYNHLYLS